MAASSALDDYHRMRDFAQTTEPRGEVGKSAQRLSFVVQKHAARRLHYDFRLELDGTLKSWAVPKGPSLDPAVKRMAVQVEDHPVSYAHFEGTIPPGHYGAGTVIVWDRGAWSPVGDARQGLSEGHLKFDLAGEKLHGRWALVRMKPRGNERQPAWLLMKERDGDARSAKEFDVLTEQPDSVLGKPSPEPKRSTRALKPTGAKSLGGKSPLPATLAPQLATLAAAIPPGDDWLYEIKFDGYRLLTRVDGDDVRCFTRNGHDWSAKLPTLVDAIKACRHAPSWLDGEVVVLDDNGVPDFQALQKAFDTRSTSALTYFVFDMPFHDGADLRAVPLTERRARLQLLLASRPEPMIRFSETFAGEPSALLDSARHVGLEGLIGKRKDSTYREGARSADWVKLKTKQRQEFVIGGYTDPKGARSGIGALLLGVHDEHGALRYAGNVGTGFDERTLASLKQRLAKLGATRSPFTDAPDRVGARGDMTPHWVTPKLLAEVSFAQWTDTGRIRHAVFHGLRDDKPAAQITRDQPMTPLNSQPATTAKPAKAAATAKTSTKATTGKRPAAKARVTHAERVIDTASGVTKGELVDFYDRVSTLMLPHLKDRPVALVRAPAGVTGAQFFQKHADDNALPGIQLLDKALDPGHDSLLVVKSAQGLQSAAQLNVIELHTWNMTSRSMPRPDRMIFDLDPGEGVDWPLVREAAQLMKSFLDDLGLKSLLKTSGGKGLHVVVPLAPRLDWQTVRAFSQAVVVHMAKVVPQRFVAKSGPRNRVGKIFIDYLRNGWGATTASAWSARARPGLGVSVPLDWSELSQIEGGAHWSVRNVDSRLSIGNQPWGAFGSSRQTLTQAMKALEFNPKET